MKKMILTLAAVVASFSLSHADNDKPIHVNNLPTTAQAFLNKHFSGMKPAMVTTERDWFDQEYNVFFTNGTKVEFDSNGNWENIKCKQTFVPDGAMPTPIVQYLKENYPNTNVTEIELDNKGYDVDLSNGMEIKFNKQFLVYKISD